MKILVFCLFCLLHAVLGFQTEIFSSGDRLENLEENVYIYSAARRAHNETLFLAIGSSIVRPGQVYRVIVSVPTAVQPVTVSAFIQRDGEQVSSASESVVAGESMVLSMLVPFNAIHGNYRLKVDGFTTGNRVGKLFERDTEIMFSERFLTILIQTNQLVYFQEQTLHIRVILLTTELKPFTDPIDAFLLDSKGIVMKRWVSVYPFLGFVNLKLEIPYDYPLGWWTIRIVVLGQIEEKEVLLDRWFTHRYDVNVDVPTFILKSEETLEGSILANFTNVALVTGNLTLKAFIRPVKKGSHSKIDWSERYLEQRVKWIFGTYDFSFSMSRLAQLAAPVPVEKCEIEVQAAVGERFFDFVVTGYGRSRVIDAKVQLRFLGAAPQIFRPGMPFKTHVSVAYDDLVSLEEDKLAKSHILVTPFSVVSGRTMKMSEMKLTEFHNGVVTVSFQAPENAESLLLRAVYVDNEDPDSKATAEIHVLSFHSKSKRFLQISTSTTVANAGEYAVFHVWSNFYMKTFNYLVASKGIVLMSGTQEVLGMVKTITTFSVPVSPEMAPALQMTIYHVSPDAHVFSDTIVLPVHAINKYEFYMNINLKQEYQAKMIELIPFLSSESIIGVSGYDVDHISTHGRRQLTPTAVLEAMYSFEPDYLNFHRALWRNRDGSPEKIFYYTSYNYGPDSLRTFENANLAVFTNLDLNIVPSFCNISSGELQCSSGQCYSKEKRCDGFKDCDDGTDEGRCFFRKGKERDDLFNFFLYRRNWQNAFTDATASNFAWANKIIGEDGEEYIATYPPSAASEYALNAIGMSKQYGLHILTEHIIFDTTKPFFITIDAPDSASLGEQIALLVVVFNYQHIEIKATITIESSDDYRFVQVEPLGQVSSYRPRTTGKEQQHLIYIKPVNHRFVHIPIVATKVGEIDITVTAKCQISKDSITHTIEITPDGVTTSVHTGVLLDMRNDAYLLRYLDVEVHEDSVIPLEEYIRRFIPGSQVATVTLIGDLVGLPVPTEFEPYLGLSALGSGDAVKGGEHIMFDFAFALYSAHYLRLTNQLKPGTQKQLMEYLNRAYVYQSVYFRNDGGYSMFVGEKASVMLTAYCTRIFHHAIYPDWETQFFVDPQILVKSVEFLLKFQSHEGYFFETTNIPWNRKMNPMFPGIYSGDVERNVALTAQVLRTMNAVADASATWKVDLSRAQILAVRYLERMLPQLNDTYQIAFTTYALLEAGSVEAKLGFNMLESLKTENEGMIYWSPEPVVSAEIKYQNQRPFIMGRVPVTYEALAVEATAYALLTYIQFGGIDQYKIVKWLTTMRSSDRGFISSQDSIVAIEALIEYSWRTHIRDFTNMKVSIESSSNPGDIHHLEVNSENLAEYREISVAPNIWGHIEVTAKGSGISLLQLDHAYNVDKDFLLTTPPVESFELTVRGFYHGRNKSHIDFHSCARWTLTEESATSGLAVLEIQLPTGYFLHKSDLDRYVYSRKVPRLQYARVFPRAAVFMFDHLDEYWTCVNFTVQRWYPVANVTRFLIAKVYDYYTAERYKENVFESWDLYTLNICEVCGSYQCPYCPYYSLSTRPSLCSLLMWTLLLTLLAYAYVL